MKKIFLGVATALGIIAATGMNSYAGDINAEESRVYSAASGTFTYNGGLYKAESSYLSQLSAYLHRDDINLNAAQADAAIRLLYRNVENGVIQGYIYRIGDAPEETVSPEEPTVNPTDAPIVTPDPQPSTVPSNKPEQTISPQTSDTPSTIKPSEGDTPDTTKQPQENQTDAPASREPSKGEVVDGDNNNNSPDENESVIPGKKEPGKNTNTDTFDSVSEAEDAAFQNTANQEKNEQILEERPDKENASGSLQYNPGDNELIIENDDGEEIVISKDSEKTKNSFDEYFGEFRNIFLTIEIALLVIIILSGIVLFIFKCFLFQNKVKSHYGNHKVRRGLRKSLGASLIYASAFNVFVIIVGFGIYVGFFQDSKVTQNLSASGYYHESFDSLMDDIHGLMDKNCVPENACDNIVTYDNYLFATKNVVQISLRNGQIPEEYSDINKEVTEALNGVGYLSEESVKQIGSDVEKLYKDYVDNIIGDTIYNLKVQYKKIFVVNIILAVINIILAFVTLLYLDHYIHRGVRKISHSLTIGSALALIVSILIYAFKPYGMLYISPDYLYIFIVTYIQYLVKVLGLLAVGGVIVGILVFIAAKSMRKSMTED